MGQNRRRHFFIHKKIQTKYLLLTVSLLFLYTMILLAAIFAPHIMALFLDIPMQQKAEAAEALLLLNKNIWPGIGMIILLFGVLSIFITHKFAGPIYVFERMAKNITGGNLTLRIKLRDGDDLEDLANNLNEMTDNMESLLISLDEEYKKLSSYIAELERELREKDISEQSTVELVHKIDNDKNNIGRILDRYSYKGKTKES